MLARTFIFASAAAATALLAGCADGSSLFNSSSSNLTTSSVAPAAAPKVDPVCISLASQIDGLRKEGIADKIEQASLKKYKMTTAELVKADQLNKANLDFQSKCSSYKPATAAAAPAAGSAAVASSANSAAAASSNAVKTAAAAKP